MCVGPLCSRVAELWEYGRLSPINHPPPSLANHGSHTNATLLCIKCNITGAVSVLKTENVSSLGFVLEKSLNLVPDSQET